jgi:hypothetical protein
VVSDRRWLRKVLPDYGCQHPAARGADLLPGHMGAHQFPETKRKEIIDEETEHQEREKAVRRKHFHRFQKQPPTYTTDKKCPAVNHGSKQEPERVNGLDMMNNASEVYLPKRKVKENTAYQETDQKLFVDLRMDFLSDKIMKRTMIIVSKQSYFVKILSTGRPSGHL